MQRILVTGASGNIGGEVVAQLRAAGLPVRALSRNPQLSSLPVAIDVARGDLTAPDTLDRALDDVDAVLLVGRAAHGCGRCARTNRVASRPDRFSIRSDSYCPSVFSTAESAAIGSRRRRGVDREVRSAMDIPSAWSVRAQLPQLVGAADHAADFAKT